MATRMERWMHWWLGGADIGEWQLPAARWQGFRLIGGAVVGTSDSLRFVPNRLEARFGGLPRQIPRSAITQASMGRRRLRITTQDGEPAQTFFVNRRELALRHLGELLTPT